MALSTNAKRILGNTKNMTRRSTNELLVPRVLHMVYNNELLLVSMSQHTIIDETSNDIMNHPDLLLESTQLFRPPTQYSYATHSHPGFLVSLWSCTSLLPRLPTHYFCCAELTIRRRI